MDLLLHIGAEKTGTTTLQSWCVANRAALRDQGVWAAQSLASPDGNSRALATAARASDQFEDGFRFWGLKTPEDHARFAADRKRAFDQEVAEARAAKARAMLISSEHLHSRLPKPDMVARARAFLGDGFDSIEVLAHLRPQIDLAVSSASTVARVGKRVDAAFFDRVSPQDPYYNYDRWIARWEAAFGAAAVRLLAFRRQPCVTTEIIDCLGLDAARLGPIIRRNEALDVWAVALTNATGLPLYDASGALDPNREMFLGDLPTIERLSPGRAVADAVTRRFAASNAALTQRRADMRPQDLQPDFAKYDRPSNMATLAALEPAGPMLRALVRRFNAALHMERARAALVNCERAVGAGNMADARDALTLAHLEIDKAERAEAGVETTHEAQWAARLDRVLQRLRPSRSL